MTKAEAEAECERLRTESPERHTHRWVPVQATSGDWQVAKIDLPPADEEAGTEIRADERPPTPDDPRPPGARDNPYAI
jgi:hypothetical protein